MKSIKCLINQIEDEMCSAKDYAERYLELKSEGNNSWASRYKEMANDEINHALNIHEFTALKIDELRKVYTPPVEMEEEWDKSHKKYIEKTTWVKTMLNM